MPASILLTVDGQYNASGALQAAQSGVSGVGQAADRATAQASALDRAMSAQASAAQRLEAAYARVDTALIRQSTAEAQAVSAADRYRVVMDALNGATGDTAALQTRAAAAFDTMASAQTRAAESGLRVADSYQRLAAVQDTVTRNEERLRAAMNAPMSSAGGGSVAKDGSGGSELGGAVKNVLLYGLAYQAASDLMSQVEQGFTRALSTQRTLAMTGATTGITPQTQAALGGYVNQLAGSGSQPFTSDVLATGLYAIPSAGIKDLGAIKAINDQATKFSAFSGSTDTQTASNALIQTMSAYGVDQSQMAKQASKYQDVITSMVNLGIVNPADVAGSVTTFGARAAQASVPFSVAGGLFAASTYTTRSGQQSAQDEDAFIRSIIAPSQTQRTAGKILGVSNLLGQQGAALLGSDPRAYFQEAFQATKLNPGLDLTKLFGTSNAGEFAMGLIGAGGSNLGRTFNAISATSQSGTTQSAFNAYEKSPAARFDDSVAAFKTAEQSFSEAALPLATGLTNFAAAGANALTDALNNWGKKTPTNPAGGTPGDTLGDFLTPGGKGFLNIDQARNMAATGQKNTGFFPSVGSTADHVVNWMDSWTWGGANASGTSGRLSTVNPTLRDTYNPPNAASTTNAFGQGSANPRLASGPAGPNTGTPGVESIFPLRAIERAAATVQQSLAGLPYASINPLSHPFVGGATYGGASAQAQLDALYGPDSTARGGASRPPDITAAQQRLAQAIANDAGKQTVESALGLYRQTVNNSPTLSSGTRAADILAQTNAAQRYERGAAGGPDQTAVSSAQANYTLAQQLGATPAALKSVFEQWIDAQRKLVMDTTKPGSQTRARELGAINQQGLVLDYGQRGDAINRQLKDLQNQAAIDTAKGNTGALGRDNAAVLAFQTKNAQFFKLDPSDLAALTAQNQAALLAANPVTNTHQFYQKNQGLGSFEAGPESTLVRAGGVDPQTQEMRFLRQEITALRQENAQYLAQIAQNTGVRAQAAAAPPSWHGRR